MDIGLQKLIREKRNKIFISVNISAIIPSPVTKECSGSKCTGHGHDNIYLMGIKHQTTPKHF